MDILARHRRAVPEPLPYSRHVRCVATATFTQSRSREVDDDRTHRTRSIGKEMCAVVEHEATGPRELQIALVDEYRRLEQGVATAGCQARVRQSTQLGVARRTRRRGPPGRRYVPAGKAR